MRKYTKSFRSLIVWQEAHKLTVLIYKITNTFPKSEIFGITSQLRRASYSIETQIAEGSEMTTPNHQLSYYTRALGSAVEVDNFLEIVKDLHFIDKSVYLDALNQTNKTTYLLRRLVQSIKPSQPTKLSKHSKP